MPRFADQTVSALLDALASPEPTPGGGTAAALAGTLGVSLLMMVAGLARTRTSSDTEKIAQAEARAALAAIRDRLVSLADTDAEAFNQVIAAYRLPKSTPEEQATRKRAIERALHAATEAPLETLRAILDAGKHLRTVSQYAIRSATSDVRVAIELVEAAAAGAVANVETNLLGLSDDAYRKATADEVLRLTNKLTEDAAAARASLAPG